MRADLSCQSSNASHVILFKNLFYSYGYDPVLDKVLKLDLLDVITRNPASVTPDMTFVITTFDLFKG